jgi:capsular polysaccharide biosynthesis protein
VTVEVLPRAPGRFGARVWAAVLALAVLFGAGGAVATILRPSSFRATAVLTVDTAGIAAADDVAPLAKASRLRELYGPLLQTQPVTETIADDVGLTQQQVADRVSAVVAKNSLLLLISATGTTSSAAQRLAGAATTALVNYTADLQQREGVPSARAASLQVLSPADTASRVTSQTRTIATVAALMALLGALTGLAVAGWVDRRKP